uniref:Glycosyl transferase CAP10 domain-containing protein n=1 Tax=Kwoniella pini CBS 10737 TaxID=1296096 RepID=A0A1B9IE85_9TREE|nr:uncharacterized protein I206_01169 [Kwoniella pini CBS 10737]OCF53862.1 hypothetical protein I206_01169 [Kwoniella pini CBS 10737]
MAFRIPTPRRGIRSILVLLILILTPYLILKHLSIIPPYSSYSSNNLPKTNSDLSKNRLAGKKDELVIKRENEIEDNDQSFFKLGSFLNDDDNELEEKQKLIRNRKKLSKNKGKIQFHNINDEEKELNKENKINLKKSNHKFLNNGLLLINFHSKHPIFELIKKSKENWNKKLNKQSKNLSESVDEYRRRYSRNPPKGFERWWNYAEKNNVQLKDEYDQIYHDLEPFHALPPSKLQSLLKESSEMSGMYTIECPGVTQLKSPHNDESEEKRVAKERAIQQLGLLEDVEDLLEQVKVVMYSHDVPWQFVGHEYVSQIDLNVVHSLSIIIDLDYPYQIDTAHLGWASACAPHKPLRHDYDPAVLPDLEGLWNGAKSFVWDHKASMDPCIHPTLTHLVGFLSGHGKGPGPSKELYPVLAMCKTTLHADVLGVSMEAWTEDVGDDPIWEEKKDDRMLWRGKTTGIYFKDEVPWNISQRINLVSKTAEPLGHIPVLDVPSQHNPNKPVGAPRNTPLSQLNAELMDVAFVDQAIQCDQDVCYQIQEGYKFAGRKTWSQGNQYKYLLDIDGNGWSARFKRLMTSNSVVLKSTIFPEWYTDRIQPWVHYIPIKADLTDLYDVLSFFRNGHDDLAKEIAVEGTKWSKSFWRKEDMIAYQFRLFLEYARLLADDREESSFTLKGEDLRKRDDQFISDEEASVVIPKEYNHNDTG